MKVNTKEIARTAVLMVGGALAGFGIGEATKTKPTPAFLGAVIPGVTRAMVCDPGYAKRARHTTQAEKDEVLRLAGVAAKDRAKYEVDHVVPLSSGGADAVANLQAQLWDGPDGARKKDLVEGYVYREVCAGRMTLVEAQALFRTPGGWQAALKRYGLDRARVARDADDIGPQYDEEGFPR